MTEPLLTTAVSAAAGQAIKSGISRLGDRSSAVSREDAEKRLASHLGMVASWSSRLQMFGMSRPRSIEQATVPLRVTDLPRRFRLSARSKTPRYNEDQLLQSQDHTLVLGDPGSGKTTILKRMARQLLISPPTNRDDAWSYPVVVVGRDQDWRAGSLDLWTVVARATGLLGEHQSLGDVGIDHADVCLVLDEARALVLFDGLDEIPISHRPMVERDLEDLGARLQHSRVVATCRSGETVALDGFSVLEICPLDQSQIASIASAWLDDPAPFMAVLGRAHTRDLANRPLFLTHLMMVAANGGGEIPDQPSALHRRIVRLMLQDWDEERGIQRRSRYASFYVEDKLDFLSALAHDFTVTSRKLRFDEQDLVRAYKRIAPPFGLPIGEARQVARELESHTGIIVESGEKFEFSHRSIQEYLTGYYIVRKTSIQKSLSLRDFPNEMAVAVALSSDPADWLENLLTSSTIESREMRSFVERLGLERPRFEVSASLGRAVFQLMSAVKSIEDSEFFAPFGTISAVRESLALVIEDYHVEFSDISVLLTPKDAGSGRGLTVKVPRELFDYLT